MTWTLKPVKNRTPIWQGRRKFYLVSLVVLGILQALVILGVSALVARIFSTLSTGIASSEWIVLLIVLSAVSLAILRWAERVCAEHLGQNYSVQVRLRLFKQLMLSDQRAAQRFSHGAMALRFVTDLSGLRQWVAVGLARLVVVVSTIIVILVILGYQQPVLMLLVAATVLVALLLVVGIGSKLVISIRAVRKYRARLAATVTDRINTVSTVQACIQEKREIRRVRKQSQYLYNATLQRAHVTGALYGALEATSVLATGAVLFMASYLVGSEQITVAEVAGSMTLLGLLLTPMRDTGRIMDYWQQWKISNEKISHFLNLPRRKLPPVRIVPPSSVESNAGHLVAQGFGIEGMLNPCDFDVPAGHHIVLDGKNGSGKTSFLLTIAGVLSLQQGQLELDGNSLIGKHGVRTPVNGIGIVSPDLGLMRGSLLRNLTYANAKVSEQELADIIDRCDLSDLIQRLPNGVNWRLSEGGKNLSLGERKRVLLARALLMHPRLLLLDELDAHLDIHSLKVIEKALRQFDGSVIEISHHRKLDLQKPKSYWYLENLHIHQRDPMAMSS